MNTPADKAKGLVPPQQLREATGWLMRLSADAHDGKELTDEELAAWIEWYESDPLHAQAFEEMQSLWGDLALVEPRIRNAGAQRSARPFEKTRWLQSVYRRVSAATPRRLWAATGLLATAALAVLTALVLSPAMRMLPDDGRLGTELAQNREAVLPDGSTVALGAQSSISLDYAAKSRRLKLGNGQAFFQVAKDKSRPFTVNTGELSVQAIGTAFDVRKNEGRVVVTVTEGIVDISTNASPASINAEPDRPVMGAPIRVAAGYQLTWDNGLAHDGREKTMQLAQVDIAHITAWRQGRLEYFNEPLSVVIANVNRYSRRQLVIESADLGNLLFTGTILVNSIDDWLNAIQRAFPVDIKKRQDGAWIIRRRLENSMISML